MGLLDKRSVKMEAVQDFLWSPSEPLLAAYTIEQGNLPARIVLVKIPERTEVRQKNLFSVSDVKMYWHPQVMWRIGTHRLGGGMTAGWVDDKG